MGDCLDVEYNQDGNDASLLPSEGTEERSDDDSDVDDGGMDDVVDIFSEMCRHKQCLDQRCFELRSCVTRMETFLRLGDHRTAPEEILLSFKRIVRHTWLCDDLCCHVPFCPYFSCLMHENCVEVLPWVMFVYRSAAVKEFWTRVEVRRAILMDTEIAWPSGHVTSEPPPIDGVNHLARKHWKFEKFPVDVEHHLFYKSIMDSTETRFAPRPGTDFNIWNEHLEEVKYGCFAEARVTKRPFMMRMEQCFFKSRKDYLEEHLANLRKLVDCQHENLPHFLCLYLLEDDSLITAYQYDFSFRSLEDACGQFRSSKEVLQIVLGLVSGARFLHLKGLLFLNWRASALVCSKCEDKSIGKLHDFQYVFNFGGKSEQELSDDDNLDTIVECLDASCIPPELLQFPKQAWLYTEVYGLGAILFHLITGYPLLYELRHKGRKTQIEAISSLASDKPDLGHQWQDFVPILSNLLGPHQNRMGLGQLEELLEGI